VSDYTIEELLIARMAREFRGNAMGVGATILSDLAARLAKALYVPDLFLTTASRAHADCDVHAKSLADEWVMSKTARMTLDWEQMFQLVAQGRLQIWIGAVQIDRHGASNISVVGAWDRPRAQLVGARGIPDDLWGCERLCYHIRRHTPKSFVERVDFQCAFGYGPDPFPAGAAVPGVVVSDLGVFDFDPVTTRMRIVSLHPGVTFERLQRQTGFQWSPLEGDIAVTPAPSDAELECIRTVIDPAGLRRLEGPDGGQDLMLELWRQELARADIEIDGVTS
jgi:acyl CoA:acetate/3-ketoacid CoA transferase beta subunit